LPWRLFLFASATLGVTLGLNTLELAADLVFEEVETLNM
jgi:hypothetical protein